MMYFWRDDNEDDDDGDLTPDLKTMASFVRIICSEAKMLEDDPYNCSSMIEFVSLFDTPDMLQLYRQKENIMKEWGHDDFAEVFRSNRKRLEELYDGMCGRCQRFVN